MKVKIIGGDGAAAPAPTRDLVELDPERQEKMIAWVEANQRMPAEMKSRILKRLRTGKAPQQMIDRISQRMGG